jgi:hypothetical protein
MDPQQSESSPEQIGDPGTPPTEDQPIGAPTPTEPLEQEPPVVDVRAQIADRLRAQRAAKAAETQGAAESVLGGDLATPVSGGEPAPNTALAQNTGRVKLTVEGKELEVSEAEVLEAGKRYLQKDHSADLKLRRASAAEQLGAQRLAEAERIRQEALALRDSGRLPSSGADLDAAGHLPSSGAGGSQAILEAGMEQAQEALFDGDRQKAGQVSMDAARLAVIHETNAMFEAEFSDVSSNPQAMQAASQAMRAELGRASIGQIPAIATRIGNQLRQQILQQQFPDPPTPPGLSVEDRAQVKARLPVTPSRTSARAPSSLPAARTPPTRSQIVHQMRVARGHLPKGA